MTESEENTGREKKKGGKAEYITPPHTIRTKVSGGGPLTSDMLKRAEGVVQKHADKYIDRAQEQIEGLVEAMRDAQAGIGDGKKSFEKIFLQSHDIRGLGSTFGYTLVSDIAASLCNFVETVEEADDGVMSVMNAHVDALRGMIGNKVIGDGGPIGREIIEGLAQAVEKNSPPQAEASE
jgi:hypothetical protein